MNNYYKKNLFIILMLIFVFPIGLILLWKSKIFNNYINSGISIFVILFSRQILVIYMIFYGYFIYPEASKILAHYCFGDGSELILKNEYIKKSPVIIYHINDMSENEKRKIGMHQLEDLRLSFALNPFTINKSKNKITISQFIKFDKTGKSITWIGPLPVPDNIVHVFNCNPYTVKSYFEISSLSDAVIDQPNLLERTFLKNHKICKGCSKRNFTIIK